MRRRFLLAGGAALLALLLTPAARAEPDPSYIALRAVRPSGAGFAAAGLTLERDAFRFRFERGTFQFLSPVEGRTVGAVFVGEGSWQLTPATDAERRQLALETGQKTLEVLGDRFQELVLLFTDDTAAEIERHGTGVDSAPARGADLYESFLRDERKKHKTNFQLRLLSDLLGHADPASGVFLAFLDGKRLPSGLAAVDPAGLEWLSPGFLFGEEDSTIYVVDPAERGFWYLARRKAKSAGGRVVHASARAERYSIDTTIQKNGGLAGVTTIRFRPLGEGLRVLPIALLDRLRIREAVFARDEVAPWTPAAFIQERTDEDSDAAVVFPEPLPRGALIRLRLTYAGSDVLRNAGEGN